jgi:hypothetical protein
VGPQYVRLACNDPASVKVLGDSRYDSDPFVTSRPPKELYNNIIVSPRNPEVGSPRHAPGTTSPSKADLVGQNENLDILIGL